MCKNLGEYPKCDCPGFGSHPADDPGTRSCYDNHCQDPTNPCMGGGDAGDRFVTCVEETTKTATMLQWSSALSTLDSTMDGILSSIRKRNGGTNSARPSI